MSEQYEIDFEAAKWPDHESFPLNKKKGNTTVEDIIYHDIEDGAHYLIGAIRQYGLWRGRRKEL